MGNKGSKKKQALPIETTFKFPSPLPTFPHGESGFASGVMDLGGGLQICQVSSFQKVWTTHDGGPDNLGASFFEPSSLPHNFSPLGFFSQPNNIPFFGFLLAAKNGDEIQSALKKPVDYTLLWTSENSNVKRDTNGYIWLPTPPDGYRSLGHVVTTSPEKPSLDKIRCVRSDLTEESDKEKWIWGPTNSTNENTFNIFSSIPKTRGTSASGVTIGAFQAPQSPLFCLKNLNSVSSSMPNITQITSLFEAYSPIIYFHPKEKYLPSSTNWFFSNGALLHTKSDQSNPVRVDPDGSNLPQGGSNDGFFWLDLGEEDRERVKNGDLESGEVYLHVKPMFGGSFTDISVWFFFPFNGPATAKVGFIDVPFRKIGEHVGDWEHLTLRISNFSGELRRVYFAQHSKGEWVDAPAIEFGKGNKTVAYCSLNGHACYPAAGLVMQGNGQIGIKNETAKSDKMIDAGAKFSVVAAEYLSPAITEPPWLNYFRQWGPKIEYKIAEEMERVEKLLPGKLKEAFKDFVNKLPDEILGEEGPTGPKLKDSWIGDERA